ncbi:UDP-N-acetyl-D-mannosamine dehydrogenase [Baekduia alba]|uniref:nucleotide sugar dehydrogenase n=1 Tax=Baekduia alba TaxID=2997333 RepID=UPI0023427FAF|nr:nucleotide sugar dehydrogenase [Baekduia alba]WCB97041.1 UDP-N-acetyl-D-mannosamine dehydrogenase [Baekduia alba]
MRAVVIALGKVGLPLAARIALAGHAVVGADVDPRVVDLVNAGEAPFPNEAGLPEALRETVADGRLRAVTDTAAAVADGPDLVVAVPPLVVDATARPDWGILDAVVADIGRGLKAGTTVSVETTVPVGTTRARVAPALEAASGLREGTDFHVVFSPERIFSGRAIEDLDKYPKLVGGLSAAGEARGIELYASFLDAEVRGLGSAEAAELSKLAETTYRDVNIAFANELARYADTLGIDVLSVIDAANSQPYSHVHRPGIAVGGHCIPVYPRFLLAGDADARLPIVAREVNERMPAYAADLVAEGVAGRRVLILGIAYRGGVKETAFSGAFPLRDTLLGRGAEVVAHDPLFSADELRAHGFEPWDGESAVDVAIVQADHAQYAALGAADLPGVQVVVDGRGILDAARFAGVPVRRIGRPEGSAQDAGSAIAPRS